VAGGWRRLHNEEFHNLYASPDILRMIKSRIMEWPGHVARMSAIGNSRTIVVGKTEGKRPLGRTMRRWNGKVGVVR